MENSPVDFAYANFAFVDDTESSSSETENKVEDVSNNKTQTSDLVELAGQTDGVSNNVESSKAGFEELPITDVKEGKVDSLAVSEVEQCDIVDVTDDKHHSVDDDTILNKIENEATASEDIINDVVTPHKNVGRAPNDIANQGSIIEITNGGINRNGNHKLGRLCADKIFRAKVIRTFFILWNYTIFGWTFGIAGPTLPDLQLITGASLQGASWLFTGFNIGYLVACATSGFVHKKAHPDILLFLYTATHAISAGVLPWIPNIYVMSGLRGVLGYCCGGNDIELTAMLFSVWQSEAGAYFQLTHFVFGIGGILSPLVAKPFMIRTIPSTLGQNITDGLANGSVSSVTMVTGWHVNFSEIKPGNWSMIPNTTRNIFDEPANLKETEVHVAYLITAVVAMSGALPFLLFFITGGRRELEKDETCSKNTKRVSNKIQVLVVTLLCIVSAVATALVDIFPSYLATFGLYQLHWSSGMGSSMTSLYFAMYAVGNFLGVFILKCISSKSFVILSYITSIGSIVIFYVGVRFAITPLQTIPIAATGLATSAILPTIFTWTQEAVTPISGMIASAFLFSGSVGAMLNPILLAYLMESVTPMSFLYLSILEAVFCFAIFIVAVLFISKFLIQDPYDVQISKSNSVVTMSNHLKEQVTKQRFRSEYYSKSTLIYF